jgi:zinc protease
MFMGSPLLLEASPVPQVHLPSAIKDRLKTLAASLSPKTQNLIRTLKDEREKKLHLRSLGPVQDLTQAQDFYEFKLANGLRVIFKESHGNEVSAKLQINSGALDDPKGKEGLAHVLEHLVASGAPPFGEEIDKVTKQNVGSNNAETSQQTTEYFINLPKDKLDLALRYLSALISGLKIDPDRLKKERGAIAAELKMHESSPSKKVAEKIFEILYGADSNWRRTASLVGTPESFEAIGLQDLQDFYDEKYLPNNAKLIISGDFRPALIKDLVNKYFGAIPARKNFQASDFSQDINPSPIKNHELKDDTLASKIIFMFPTGKFNHRKDLIMDLISFALAGGSNGRLDKRLVEVKKPEGEALASFVFAGSNADAYKGHLSIDIKPYGESSSAEAFRKILKIIEEELKDIAENGISEDERQRFIKMHEIHETFKKDRQHADLGSVASYAADGEDWRLALKIPDDLKSISNDEIKLFAAEFLNPFNRYGLVVHGKGKDLDTSFQSFTDHKVTDSHGDSAEAKISDREDLLRTVLLAGGLSALHSSLSGVETFRSGTKRISFREDHSLPIVFLNVTSDGGALLDPPDKEGLAALTMGLASRVGTFNQEAGRDLDKETWEKIIQSTGIKITKDTDEDSVVFGLKTLSKDLDLALALLSEKINHSALLNDDNPEVQKRLQHEFELQKKQSLDILESIVKIPSIKESIELSRLLYPKASAYRSRTLEETRKFIESISLDDIKAFYRSHVAPRAARITASGDLTKLDLKNKILAAVDSWRPEAQKIEREKLLAWQRLAPVETKGLQVKQVETGNNRPEINVSLANTIDIRTSDPDYYPALLANMILGNSSFNSRLMQYLREELNLVYHIGSTFDSRLRGASSFNIDFGCAPDKVEKAIEAVMLAINKFLIDGPSDAELEIQKSRFILTKNTYATNSRENTHALMLALQEEGKDPDFHNKFAEMLRKITKEDVLRAARRLIQPENFAVVISKPKSLTHNIPKIKSIIQGSNAKKEAELGTRLAYKLAA